MLRILYYFVVIQLLDILTSILCFRLGGFEINPFTRFILNNYIHPYIFLFIIKVSLGLLGLAYCYLLKSNYYIMEVATGLYFLVPVFNLTFMLIGLNQVGY